MPITQRMKEVIAIAARPTMCMTPYVAASAPANYESPAGVFRVANGWAATDEAGHESYFGFMLLLGSISKIVLHPPLHRTEKKKPCY